MHFRGAKLDQRLKNPNSSRFVPLPTSLIDAGFLIYVDEVKRAGFDRLFPHLPYNAENGYGKALGDQFRAYAIKRGLTQRLKSLNCFRHTLSNSLVNEHVVSLPISQQITGHELTLLPGLKHYVDPPSVPARFSAIEQFGPPLSLPAYTPGQFDRSFKQVRHMERRREQRDGKELKRTPSTSLNPDHTKHLPFTMQDNFPASSRLMRQTLATQPHLIENKFFHHLSPTAVAMQFKIHPYLNYSPHDKLTIEDLHTLTQAFKRTFTNYPDFAIHQIQKIRSKLIHDYQFRK